LEIERKEVVSGRTWQSLKNRLLKGINNNLKHYGTSEEDLKKSTRDKDEKQ